MAFDVRGQRAAGHGASGGPRGGLLFFALAVSAMVVPATRAQVVADPLAWEVEVGTAAGAGLSLMQVSSVENRVVLAAGKAAVEDNVVEQEEAVAEAAEEEGQYDKVIEAARTNATSDAEAEEADTAEEEGEEASSLDAEAEAEAEEQDAVVAEAEAEESATSSLDDTAAAAEAAEEGLKTLEQAGAGRRRRRGKYGSSSKSSSGGVSAQEFAALKAQVAKNTAAIKALQSGGGSSRGRAPSPPPPPPPPRRASTSDRRRRTPSSGGSSRGGSTAGLGKEQKIFLNEHNVYRCMHGVPLMSWDTKIEQIAKRWADRGQFAHGGMDGYPGGRLGQNLAMGADSARSVKMWYDEIKLTSGGRVNSFSGGTGHYTQVVWKKSTKLGCATGPRKIVVCDYFVAGNLQGAFSQNVQGPRKSEDACRKELGAPKQASSSGRGGGWQPSGG